MNLSHNLPKNELDAALAEALDSFRQAPPRDAQAAQAGRAAFLAQARRMAPPPHAKSGGLFGWLAAPRVSTRKMAWQPIYSVLTAALLLSVLLFGGSTAAVYAAQDSLPGGMLYGLKLSGEDLHMALTSDETAQLDLALEYTSRRVAEIENLVYQGQPLAPEVLFPLRASLEQSLNLAAAAPDDPDMQHILGRIETHVRLQLQVLERAQILADSDAQAGLLQAHWMLQRQLQWAQDGRIAPLTFRQQAPDWFPESPPREWPPVGPGPASPTPSGSPTPVPTVIQQTPAPKNTQGSGNDSRPAGTSGPHRSTDMPGQGGPDTRETGEPGSGKGQPGGLSATQTPDPVADGQGGPPADPGMGNGAGLGGGSSMPPSGNSSGPGGKKP